MGAKIITNELCNGATDVSCNLILCIFYIQEQI